MVITAPQDLREIEELQVMMEYQDLMVLTDIQVQREIWEPQDMMVFQELIDRKSVV